MLNYKATTMQIEKIENEKEYLTGYFNFLILLHGNITISTGNHQYTVHKRSYLFYDTSFTITTASPYLEGYTISLSKEEIEKLPEVKMFLTATVSFFELYSLKELEVVKMLLSSLYNSMDKNLSTSYLHILTNKIITSNLLSAKQQLSTFEQFSALIDEHLENNYCAGEYAQMLDIPLKELIKEVKTVADETPCSIITGKVIERAKSKLLETSDSSKMIAYQLGFEDPYYFIKYFKRNTGLTPTQFRASETLLDK